MRPSQVMLRVSGMPMDSTSCRRSVSSAISLSNFSFSASISRTPATYFSPAGVSWIGEQERSNSDTPSDFSMFCTHRVSVGCDTKHFSAALEKLRCSATAIKYRNLTNSTKPAPFFAVFCYAFTL